MNWQHLSCADRQFCLGTCPNPPVILKGVNRSFKAKIQTAPDDIFSPTFA
ncbi:hypothetical protein LCA211_0325 [Lacticaseibacillus casei 21/1]|nr:hypothetical protein LCA211_0325 [Lacticaseibacillus casei 21/1]